MRYQATLTLSIKSRFEQNRVDRQIRSLFESGTVTESLAVGLQLNDAPRLMDVVVERLPRVLARYARLEQVAGNRRERSTDSQAHGLGRR